MKDLRLAFRALARSPGFTIVIVLTLALGIGANTAIFRFFHGILLRPLPYEDPERTVMVKRGARNFSDIMGEGVGLQSADFIDLQSQARSFSALTAYTSDVATYTGRGTPDLLYGAVVPANFFSVLGSHAVVGRAFSADDAAKQSGRLIVLSHALWQSKFGGDPSIIGQPMTMNGVAFTVTGVMAPDFNMPRSVVYWVSAAGPAPEGTIGRPPGDFGGRGNFLRTVIGRLAPGVSIAQAEKEVAALVLRLPNPANTDRVVYLANLRDQSVGSVRMLLGLLSAGVALVLLIACLNIGNLMLSRATTRQRELSIRLALGAGRWDIARQLLAESLVLSLLGGAAGVALSWWGVGLLVAIAPEDIPRLTAVSLDRGVLYFAVGISVLTGIVCGLAPIVGTWDTDLTSSMKAGDRGGSGRALPRRLRAVLVGGEVALSLILLIAAGLLLRSFREMIAVSWGFEPRHVAMLRVAFTDAKYDTPEARRVFYRRMMTELAAKPGFDSVAASFDKIGESWVHLPFSPEGHAFAKPEDVPTASYHFVSTAYFRTLGITLVQGRSFTDDDSEDAPPVIVIDAATARNYFPDGQAVGKRVQIQGRGNPMAEIIGIAADVKADGPEAPARPDIYIPYLQRSTGYVYVFVRTALDVATVGTTIQQVVREIDAGSPTTELGAMTQVIERPAANRRFPLVLIGMFSALALALAGVGIYAVTAYGVAQRTRELGVRMALGAPPRAVIALILQQGLRPIAIGVFAGVAGGGVTAYLMRGLLFGVSPLDAPTFVLVPLLLVAIAVLACLVPARRATKVDPLIALRTE